MHSSAAATSMQFINDARDDGQLALAITNDEGAPATVRLQVFDLNGRLLATTQFVVLAKSTYARFLHELVADLPARHIGPVRLGSTQFIYVTGLRYTGTLVTAVPPALSGFIQ